MNISNVGLQPDVKQVLGEYSVIPSVPIEADCKMQGEKLVGMQTTCTWETCLEPSA